MRIANKSPFLAAVKVTSRTPPRPEMAVIVRAAFLLSPAEPLRVPDGPFPASQGHLTAEVLVEDDDGKVVDCVYPGDFADFKPRPEVIVRGICHPPKGHPAEEHTVRIAVGKWSKAARIPASARAPFGPVPASAPERTARMGKQYGPDYQAKRAPFYAADFDFAYFNSAPPDQWLESLRGDEQVTFTNLHPDARTLSKALPGLRMRAFVKDEKGEVREVPMRPDTLFADMEAERLYLTYRGLVPVAEVDLHDVATVLVASEPLNEPERPAGDYHSAIEAFEAGPADVDEGVPEHVRDLARAIRRGESPTAPVNTSGQQAASDPLSAFLDQKLGHLAAPERARLGAAIGALLRRPAPEGANLREALAAAVRSLPVPAAAPPPVSADAPRAPIGQVISRALAATAAAGKRASAQGVSTKGLNPAIALAHDPRIATLDPAGFAGAGEGPEQLVPGADLRGRDLRGRDLRGLDLRGADLSDALLSGAILRGAVLAGANLTRTALDGADLSAADLSKACLTLAGLTQAILDDAALRGASLDRANARKTSFRRADLSGVEGVAAVFEQAVFDDAKLGGARLREAVFDEASLAGCDLARADLVKCRFLGARAPRASFERAAIAGTSFAGADLSGARFIESTGEGAIFTRAAIGGADFRYARLAESHFTEAHGEGAAFRAADLRASRFYRARLPRAVFAQANLFGADLCRSGLARARFEGASLYDAKLLGADVSGCDFSEAITKRSTLERT